MRAEIVLLHPQNDRPIPVVAKSPAQPPEPLPGKRIGVAKGRWVIPDDIDQDNALIADLFENGPIDPTPIDPTIDPDSVPPR
jgi:hypothetical protein